MLLCSSEGKGLRNPGKPKCGGLFTCYNRLCNAMRQKRIAQFLSHEFWMQSAEVASALTVSNLMFVRSCSHAWARTIA